MKLKPQQTVVGPYLWKARCNRGPHGARQNAYTYHATSNGIPAPGRDGVVVDLRNEIQSILSRENPVHYLGRKNHPEEIGGNFENYKIEVVLDSWVPEELSDTRTTNVKSETPIPIASTQLDVVSNAIRNSGLDFSDSNVMRPWLQARTPARVPDNDLDIWGTQVIASILPTSPVADLSTTLAELASEGKFFELPSEKSTFTGGYLNYQFGVAPTVGFAKDLRKAVSNRDAIIEQYERDAGKRIRRQFGIPPVKTTTKTVGTLQPLCGYGGFNSVPLTVAGRGTLTTTTTTETWKSFSGAFTYYLPKRDTIAGDLARLDKLYGVNPLNNIFGTGWELTPYSWLVDYFASSGAYQKNIDAFKDDSLVMPYAYVMASTKKTVTYEWTGLVMKGKVQVQKTYRGSVNFTTQQRRQATPYGFGKSSSSLTAKQVSILAALGISRVF